MSSLPHPRDSSTVCECCGDTAYYVIGEEALDFCADCAVSLLGETTRRQREALERIAAGAGNGRPSLDAAQAMYVARGALDA